MRSVDFYEFVGILVPGAVLLLAVGIIFDTGPAEKFIAPDAVGNMVVYLVLAYVSGHLVQAPANWLEMAYWKLWGGMPTDWPMTRPNRHESADWRNTLQKYCHESCKAEELGKWRRMMREARSTLYATNRASRLHVFNGNYGMFRGMLTTELIIAAFAWAGNYNVAPIYFALVLVTGFTVYRMHRFAVDYARELFANIAELEVNQSTS